VAFHCCWNRISILSNNEPLWSWSYGCWIYNYLSNWCISPLQKSLMILKW